MRTSALLRYLLVAVLFGATIPAHGQGLGQIIQQAPRPPGAPAPPPPPDPRKSPSENIAQEKKAIEETAKQLPGATEAAKAAQGAEKAATDLAKQGAELPGQIAKEGVKLTVDAASELFKQVEDIVQKGVDKLEEKAKAKLRKFWDDIKLYVYLAAAALFAILVIPAIISSIITVWLVRRMDRRRERKAQLAAKGAR